MGTFGLLSQYRRVEFGGNGRGREERSDIDVDGRICSGGLGEVLGCWFDDGNLIVYFDSQQGGPVDLDLVSLATLVIHSTCVSIAW